MFFSIVFMIFMMISSVSAIDSNVTTDDSNLLNENNKIVFSSQNLEVSSYDSISENTSHDDNLKSYFSNEDKGLLTSQYVSDDILNVNDTKSTSLAGNDTELYFKNGTAYKVVLTDSDGSLLSNQNVIFNINGNNYTRVTNDEGIASIAINLNSGNYNITSFFAGTSSYEPSSTVNLVKVLSTISGEDVEKYYKNGTQYYATFLDGNGALLNNVAVVFNINGVFYERETDESGTARLNINLNSGDYVITATNTLNGEMHSNFVKVLPTILASDVVKYYKNNTQYYATFLNDVGNPISNTDVIFNINGVYYTRSTNDRGVARLNINLNPNNYTITATNPNNGEMLSNNIEVLPTISANDMNMTYRSGRFVANILDDMGAPLTNTNVTFNINGVLYNRLSDDEGNAYLNINLNLGNYIITSTHPNGLSVSNTISIAKAHTTILGNDAHIIVGTDRIYNVTLMGDGNKTISSTTVHFNYNGISQDVITDENGVASIHISNLTEGSYTINYGFDGNDFYYASNGQSTLVVADSTVILTGNDLKMYYKDGSKFNVTLTELDKTPLVNKTISFTVNGRTYNRITDDDGVASLTINLIPGTFDIFYSYSQIDSEDYNEGSNTIVVNKLPAKLSSEDLFLEHDEPGSFKTTLVDGEDNPIANATVTFNINSVSYNRTTNASGVAKLNINLNVGYYAIKTSLDNAYYSAKTITNHILVNGTIFVAEDLDMIVGTTAQFSATLLDAYRKPISGATIEFEYANVKTSAVTNADGVATITISGLDKGIYPIVYRYDDNEALSLINVIGTISIGDLVSAAMDVNSFIEANTALPGLIRVGDEQFTTAQYLFLISQAIVNINAGDYSNLYTYDVNNPSNPGAAANMGYLNEYVNLAGTVLSSMQQGITPNSVETSVGNVGYDGIVYALTRVIVYYGLTNQLPSSVYVKSLKLYESQSVLDKQNTISDLGPYLSSSSNCQVTNPAIVDLANRLTYGLTNSYDKAVAIYNYVRDDISYSFYYDTRYGAVGTLNAGTGNCVDQSHLSVALYRAAGLPARYVHGTCVFSSGSTYGHVWTQVLLGDTWVVSDSTSTRNSFGVVVNWNNYNYSLIGYYSILDF